MAKTRNPLMSLTASGKIGERLVFSQRKSGQQARFQKAQKDVITADRLVQRAEYTARVNAWNVLTQPEKDDYIFRAKNLNMTGYNLFMSGGALPPPVEYTLTYNAGANGKVDGESQVVQVVEQGHDGEAVTAEPDDYYSFDKWDDDVEDNPRTDLNVQNDITVEAEFLENTPDLIDSYSESNYDGSTYYLDVDDSTSYVGHSFSNVNLINLFSAKFYCKRIRTNSVGVVAYLYAMTGDYGSTSKPTGSPLAVSDTVNINDFSISYALKEFFFTGANRIVLNANTKYCIVIHDLSNPQSLANLEVGGCWDGSHAGNDSYSADGSLWYADSPDIPFYVYGIQK